MSVERDESDLTLREMRSLVAAARQIAQAPSRAARREALRYGTALAMVMALGLGAFGWTVWQQAQANERFARYVYEGCLYRNGNDAKSREVWMRLAGQEPNDTKAQVYLDAAQAIRLRDCSVYLH